MKKWIVRQSLLVLIINAALNWPVNAAVENPGRTQLKSCISAYKDGDFQKAADNLQALLPSLSHPKDQMEAYKYLGLSYGMLNQIDKSKEVFKTFLNKYPDMDIDTLEVPPNIAIIFKQAKLENKIEKIDTTRKGNTQIIVQKKNIVAPVIVLSAAIASAGVGGNLFLYGNQQYQKYKSVTNADEVSLMDRYYNNSLYSYIGGAACLAATAVLLPVSIHLFMKKDHPKKDITVSFVNGWPSLVCLF
jgi:hypothetical protein